MIIQKQNDNLRENNLQKINPLSQEAIHSLSEVFLDNLAGFPNNISRRGNGNFWVGFTTKRNDQLDEIHPKILYRTLFTKSLTSLRYVSISLFLGTEKDNFPKGKLSFSVPKLLNPAAFSGVLKSVQ